MSFLDRVFRRRARDLRVVSAATRVELECRVASPDVVVSPVSGTRAALVRWNLLEQRTFSGGKGGGSHTRYRVLARGLYESASVLLAHRGERVEVPLAQATLVLYDDPEDGELLNAIPPALEAVVRELRVTGPIAYREEHLRSGSRVQLTATVERLRTPGAGGYRAAAEAGPELRALPDERLVLREQLG